MYSKGDLLYQSLNDSDSEESMSIDYDQRRPTSSNTRAFIHFALLYVVNAALLVTVLFLLRSQAGPTRQLYSPADVAVEYEVRTLVSGFGPSRVKTAYMGPPNNATDRLWEDLYQVGVSVVPTEDADRLPQKTSAIKGHPNQHMLILGVFHKLHCLNKMRKSLYPKAYGEIFHADGTKDMKMMGHLEHCIDLFRQAFMCQADTSVGYFLRNGDGDLEPQANVTRVCRKFDRIREWALEHHATVPVVQMLVWLHVVLARVQNFIDCAILGSVN